MCLSLPGRVTRIMEGEQPLADINVAGTSRTVDLSLLEEPVEPGDYVLFYTGFAMARVSPEEAEQLQGLIAGAESAYEQLAAETTALRAHQQPAES